MGRQQRRNAGRSGKAPPDAVLEDPISTTQRQTLPVLPAPPPEIARGAPAVPEDVDTLVAPSYSRPGRRTLADATGATAVPSRAHGAERTPRAARRAVAPDASASDADARLPVPLSAADADRRLALPSEAPGAPPVVIRGAERPRHPGLHVVPRRQGSLSFVSQFFVGMLTVMVLVSTVTLASPLGRSAALAGAFQGYANSVPWVPTPTHTPRPKPTYAPPKGANPGQQAVIDKIVAIFGSNAPSAINVARCESGFDPNAYNPYAIGNSHAEGVFQILYPSTWSTTSYASSSPYNYDANIRAAHQIFARDGYSWREWECQP